MLKLSGCINQQFEFTEVVDDYVPLTLKIGPGLWPSDEVFYWRATDTTYLMEVKIAPKDGMLLGLDITLVPKRSVRLIASIKAMVDAYEKNEEGMPAFDLAPWIAKVGATESRTFIWKRIIDEAIEFELLVARDGVGVTLSGCHCARMIRYKNLSFAFDADDNFCGLFIEGLERDKYKKLLAFG